MVVDRGGSGVGLIVGAIVLVVLLMAAWYLTLGPGQGTFGGNSQQDINVNVDLPSAAPAAS